MKRTIAIFSLFFCFALGASAQKFSVATNLTDWIYLATINAHVQSGVAQHWTLSAEARINPVSWQKDGKEIDLLNRQQTYALGARYWGWYTYSGWWLGSALQYQEYDRSSWSFETKEAGDAYGLSLSGGYDIQLNEHINIDLGISFWGGATKYNTYAFGYYPEYSPCVHAGPWLEGGWKGFVRFNTLYLSFTWIF